MNNIFDMQGLTSYTILVPNEILGKIRLLSAQRKVEKRPNATQKAIFVELLKKGLLFANDELPTETTPNP